MWNKLLLVELYLAMFEMDQKIKEKPTSERPNKKSK